jgi:hypothetical protein
MIKFPFMFRAKPLGTQPFFFFLLIFSALGPQHFFKCVLLSIDSYETAQTLHSVPDCPNLRDWFVIKAHLF